MNCLTFELRPAIAGEAAIMAAAREFASVAARTGSPSWTVRWTRVDSRGASATICFLNSSVVIPRRFSSMTCWSSGPVVASSAYVWESRWLASN